MLSLTIHANHYGILTFSTQHQSLQVIGEFLIDAACMPDFVRAFLSSPANEEIIMNKCTMKTEGNVLHIVHLYKKDLPHITIAKERALNLIDILEEVLIARRALQSIIFKEEELGLSSLQKNTNTWQPQKKSSIKHKE
jgi:hypothetical protein